MTIRLNKYYVFALALLMIMLLSGFQSISSALGASDMGTTATTIGQYALLAWLIVRAENRQAEQQTAWREERRWLINLLVTGKIEKIDEN